MNLKLNSVTKKFRYGSLPRPGRDWLVLLGLFVIGLAASVIYNLWTFTQVTQGQTVGNVPVNVPAEIKLNQVNALFDARAQARQAYGSEYRFVDPSL